MTFAKRALRIQFTLRDGTLDDGKSTTVDLTNLRAEVVVDQPGRLDAFDSLNMRVLGVPVAVMNKFATPIYETVRGSPNRISVAAGDEGGPLHSIFDGSIISALPDYSGHPEVSFNLFAQSGFFGKVAPAAPNSYAGQVNVADAIEALAKQMGFGFTNNGVKAYLNDQYLSGPAMAQVQKLVEAADICFVVSNNVISIWPNGGAIDNKAIDVSSANGLVGYPQFDQRGVLIRTEFRPDLRAGRMVNLTSVVPQASGQWFCLGSRHELSTLTTGGPWFTGATLNKNLNAPR